MIIVLTAEIAEIKFIPFAVDPAGQRDRYPGKGNKLNHFVVKVSCLTTFHGARFLVTSLFAELHLFAFPSPQRKAKK